MDIMDLIMYGGVALGAGIVCLIGYRLTRGKRIGQNKDGKQVMGKINEFYGSQDAGRDRFKI